MRANWSRSRRAGAVAGLAFVAVAFLVACGRGGGSAGSSSSLSSSAPGGSSSSVDPSLKVPAPLQAQELLSNPCSALTDAQVTGLGLKPPGRITKGLLDLCAWSGEIRENGVSVGAVPQNKGGISDIYAKKAKSAYFEPVTVNGYPGVFADIQDGRLSGSCSLWVGITDQLAFTVITSINIGQNKAHACRSAQKTAEAVVTHLKGAA